jgi:hypothetical protein
VRSNPARSVLLCLMVGGAVLLLALAVFGVRW